MNSLKIYCVTYFTGTTIPQRQFHAFIFIQPQEKDWTTNNECFAGIQPHVLSISMWSWLSPKVLSLYLRVKTSISLLNLKTQLGTNHFKIRPVLADLLIQAFKTFIALGIGHRAEIQTQHPELSLFLLFRPETSS